MQYSLHKKIMMLDIYKTRITWSAPDPLENRIDVILPALTIDRRKFGNFSIHYTFFRILLIQVFAVSSLASRDWNFKWIICKLLCQSDWNFFLSAHFRNETVSKWMSCIVNPFNNQTCTFITADSLMHWRDPLRAAAYFQSGMWQKGTKLHFKSPTAERRHAFCVGVGRDRTHAGRPQWSRVCLP